MDSYKERIAETMALMEAAGLPERRGFADDAEQFKRAITEPRETSGPAFIHTKPEQRRNDPCPCGSGKKYKRCCLYANS